VSDIPRGSSAACGAILEVTDFAAAALRWPVHPALTRDKANESLSILAWICGISAGLPTADRLAACRTSDLRT